MNFVKLYEDYDKTAFEDFVRKNVSEESVDFIDENNLWSDIFYEYTSGSGMSTRYYDKDRVIDALNAIYDLREEFLGEVEE